MDRKRFRELVKTKRNVSEALRIVNRHFCKPLEMRGLCNDCEACAFHINRAFDELERVDREEGLRVPMAMLTWLMKDARENVIEGHEEPEAETELDDLLLKVGQRF